jgi:hypothetical protein
VVADKAHHVALRRVGRAVPRRWHYPLRRAPIFIGRQLAGGDQLAKGQWVTDDLSQAYGSKIVRGWGGAMRRGKGRRERRTRNGGRALMATPHGGKGEVKTKRQRAETVRH